MRVELRLFLGCAGVALGSVCAAPAVAYDAPTAITAYVEVRDSLKGYDRPRSKVVLSGRLKLIVSAHHRHEYPDYDLKDIAFETDQSGHAWLKMEHSGTPLRWKDTDPGTHQDRYVIHEYISEEQAELYKGSSLSATVDGVPAEVVINAMYRGYTRFHEPYVPNHMIITIIVPTIPTGDMGKPKENNQPEKSLSEAGTNPPPRGKRVVNSI